jgi:hypothetical protein
LQRHSATLPILLSSVAKRASIKKQRARLARHGPSEVNFVEPAFNTDTARTWMKCSKTRNGFAQFVYNSSKFALFINNFFLFSLMPFFFCYLPLSFRPRHLQLLRLQSEKGLAGNWRAEFGGVEQGLCIRGALFDPDQIEEERLGEKSSRKCNTTRGRNSQSS